MVQIELSWFTGLDGFGEMKFRCTLPSYPPRNYDFAFPGNEEEEDTIFFMQDPNLDPTLYFPEQLAFIHVVLCRQEGETEELKAPEISHIAKRLLTKHGWTSVGIGLQKARTTDGSGLLCD